MRRTAYTDIPRRHSSGKLRGRTELWSWLVAPRASLYRGVQGPTFKRGIPCFNLT